MPEADGAAPVGGSAAYALTHTSFSHRPSRWTYYPVQGESHDGTAVALPKIRWRAPSNAVPANIDSRRGGVTSSSAMSTFAPLLWTTGGERSPALLKTVNIPPGGDGRTPPETLSKRCPAVRLRG
ncbi:hypothetical protein OHB54_22995 [Streptomyces sp. NBC_01007]|nr:hypothetical protein OHB54_22995 [Streptomyces sp. NBC_01007]